jgi:insecticidal toxin complex protein TccC
MSLHQNTPTLTVSDPRGLVVRTVSWHRSATQDTVQARTTLQRYDAIGRLNQQSDPRLSELSDLANQSMRYSLSGQVLLSESVDAGWRLAFHDAAGQLRDSWDGRDTHRRFTYDELMRPVNVFEHEPPLCVERFTYAGADEEAARHNRCGQLLRHDDQAGSLWHDAFALTGQPLSEARRFCTALTPPQWTASEADLEDTAYTTRWRHDALGAVIEQTDALRDRQRIYK